MPKRAVSTLLVFAMLGFVLASAVGLFLLVCFHTYYMPSESMSPTVQINDVLLANRYAYARSEPKDGDIVTFRPPIPSNNPFIKRVIGVPGDRIRIHDGVLYRNGNPVQEPFLGENTEYELEIKNDSVYVDGIALDPSQANLPPRDQWTAPDRVPPKCYLLLGDNRNASEDSHIWGFAQAHGAFASGPRAGQSAGSMEQVVRIVAPWSRARNL